MSKGPIVDEVRAARAEIAAEHGNDDGRGSVYVLDMGEQIRVADRGRSTSEMPGNAAMFAVVAGLILTEPLGCLLEQ